MKVHEISKLRALTVGPAEVTGLRSMLEAFARRQDGANPAFLAFARTELEDCRDVDELRRRYPPWRPEAWTEYRAAAAVAAGRLAATAPSAGP